MLSPGGKRVETMSTAADGACAIHSVWGEWECGESAVAGASEGAGMGLYLWASRVYQQLAFPHAMQDLWQACTAVGCTGESIGSDEGGSSQEGEVAGSTGDPDDLSVQIGEWSPCTTAWEQFQCFAGTCACRTQ